MWRRCPWGSSRAGAGGMGMGRVGCRWPLRGSSCRYKTQGLPGEARSWPDAAACPSSGGSGTKPAGRGQARAVTHPPPPYRRPLPRRDTGGSAAAGGRRPAPALAPRGCCHHVRKDQLSPYKSAGRPSGAALRGCLFSFLLARACPADPQPGLLTNPSALPPCCRFAARATWDYSY